jgi:hypothetical protein
MITVTVHSIADILPDVPPRARRVTPTRWFDPGCGSSLRASADLRVKSNFSNRIKVFLPVQSPLKKYSVFPK